MKNKNEIKEVILINEKDEKEKTTPSKTDAS